MRGFLQLVRFEFLLQLRQPFAAFFTLAFPPMLVLIFGSIYGNAPRPDSGGYGTVDISVPGYIALIVITAAIFNLPISLASYRERGILRRLAVTPVSPLVLLSSQLSALAILIACGTVLLVLVAKVGYDLRFPGSLPSAFAAGLIGAGALLAVGFALAAVMPSARTATVAAMVIAYPMLFLSGAALPRELLPTHVREFAAVLPATPLVTLLRAAWDAQPWWRQDLGAILASLAWSVAGTAVAAWRFRWE